MPTVTETYQVGDEELVIQINMDNVRAAESGVYRGMRDGAPEKGKGNGNAFERGIQLARNCATVAVQQFKKTADELMPNEYTIEVGIQFDGELGASLVTLGGEAHMQISMTWKPKP